MHQACKLALYGIKLCRNTCGRYFLSLGECYASLKRRLIVICLSQRLGALASATPIANSTTDPKVKADALEWKGVYNKVVKINDNWAAVTIPEADSINGTTPSVKYDSTSKTYTITTGATRYAGNTYYVYIGGKTVDPAGSINSVNATENGGVTSAIGGAIATVNDGKTYTITIGANGAKVYNNAKLEPSPSTVVIQTIPAGTKLSGTKLTAAYLDGTEYRFQSVYKITYNGYTAYISAGDVAGVEKGDDEQEREDDGGKADAPDLPGLHHVPLGETDQGNLILVMHGPLPPFRRRRGSSSGRSLPWWRCGHRRCR